MRINIHDKFKSWRHFIKFVKGLYRSLDKRGVEIKSICVYANIVDKESQKSTSLYLCDEDDKMLGEVGIDAGYFEWLNHEYDGMILQYKLEDELLNQAQYNYERKKSERKIFDDKEEKHFEDNYLPVTCETKGGRKVKIFTTISEMQKRGYNWKFVKKAIDNDRCYKNKIWKSEKLFKNS